MMDVEGPATWPSARYDELLAPSTKEAQHEASFTRASASYTNMDERFRTSRRTFERQYSQLYYSRLMLLKGFMKRRVQALWPGVAVCSILEVQESKEVAVIGTIYKSMKLKPSILDEYTKDRGLKAALGGAGSFCSDDDGVVLEDEGARMVLSVARGLEAGLAGAAEAGLEGAAGAALRATAAGGAGPLNVHELVTGLVVAVRGVHEPGGDFFVTAVCYPGMAPHPHPHPHPPLPPPPAATAGGAAAVAAGGAPGDKYIAFASGFCLGGSKADMLKIQLALDFLSGNLGSPAEQQLSAQIVRLVLVGGGIGQLDNLASAVLPGGPNGASSNPYSRAGQAAGAGAALQPVRDLDLLLAEVACALPVDLMPGAEDPANVALPQQPMHRCLFPASAAYGSFVRATNPHEFESEGVRLLGCSGQNVDDLAKYCGVRDRLDLMERSLAARHLAPTAPDTLACYPFQDQDPFILQNTPHVYFVGNQPEFATRLARQAQLPLPQQDAAAAAAANGAGGVAVRLVAVPSFARSGTVVLLNLRTLACHPVRFDASFGV